MASPKFTKQHYEVLAALLANRRQHLNVSYPEPPVRTTANDHEVAGRKAELTVLSHYLAAIFADDNSRFNRQRFLDAAGEKENY